ncbi:hypothetical protein CapIbe_002787 [Capra ibex]
MSAWKPDFGMRMCRNYCRVSTMAHRPQSRSKDPEVSGTLVNFPESIPEGKLQDSELCWQPPHLQPPLQPLEVPASGRYLIKATSVCPGISGEKRGEQEGFSRLRDKFRRPPPCFLHSLASEMKIHTGGKERRLRSL